MLKSTVSHSYKLYHHKWKKLEISEFYIAVCGRFYPARMILSGLGCRLQTCSCLATEWFNSTFRAKWFLFFSSSKLDIRMRVGPEDLGPASGDVAAVFIFAAQVFPCEYIHTPHPCPLRGKPKNSKRWRKIVYTLSSMKFTVRKWS